MLPGLCLPPFPSGGGAPISTMGWDPANQSPDITLTNGNLTAARTALNSISNWVDVRATLGKATGKWYFEIHVDAMTFNGGLHNISIGVISGIFSPNNFVGNGVGGGAYGYHNLGGIFSGGANIAPMDTYSAGHVLAIALDRTNLKIHFRNVTTGGNWNANAGHNPATNTGGFDTSSTLGAGVVVYPAISVRSIGDSGSIISALTGPVPPGFLPWDS